jgi:hypothetical protein
MKHLILHWTHFAALIVALSVIPLSSAHAQPYMQWTATYDGVAHDYDGAGKVVVDAAGNVYVTGHANGVGSQGDIVTLKYNLAGVQQWTAIYHQPGIS